MSTMSTIFTRIIDGEIPAQKIYEDDMVIAILDIEPVQKWHMLVITKHPYPWMQECDDASLSHAFLTAKKLMTHMKEKLWCDYVHLVVEWVQVPHFHIHLIPSMLPVKNAEWHHTKYEAGEMADYQAKLQMNN